MAKGFAAGLVQGALACGAGLLVLSLVLPQPPRPADHAALSQQESGRVSASVPQPAPPQSEPPPEAGPEPAAAIPVPADSAADSVPQDTPAPDPAGPETAAPADVPPPESPAEPSEDAPVAETLSLPAGSEFARGGDAQPQLPPPLTGIAPPVTAPVPVALPAGEIAPAPADPAAMPEARGDAPVAPVMRAPEQGTLDLPHSTDEAPIAVAPPGQVQTPGLDRQPVAAADAGAAGMPGIALPAPELALPDTPPVAEAAAVVPPAVAALTAADQPAPEAAVAARPAAAGSGFDLSTPPGLAALLNPTDE